MWYRTVYFLQGTVTTVTTQMTDMVGNLHDTVLKIYKATWKYLPNISEIGQNITKLLQVLKVLKDTSLGHSVL